MLCVMMPDESSLLICSATHDPNTDHHLPPLQLLFCAFYFILKELRTWGVDSSGWDHPAQSLVPAYCFQSMGWILMGHSQNLINPIQSNPIYFYCPCGEMCFGLDFSSTAAKHQKRYMHTCVHRPAATWSPPHTPWQHIVQALQCINVWSYLSWTRYYGLQCTFVRGTDHARLPPFSL